MTLRSGARRPSLRQIQKVPSGAVVDLDDPEIAVEAQLAGDARLDVEGRRGGEDRAEAAVPRILRLEQGLGGRAVEVGAAVEAVDLDEDRAGLGRSPVAHHRRDALDVEAAQVG